MVALARHIPQRLSSKLDLPPSRTDGSRSMLCTFDPARTTSYKSGLLSVCATNHSLTVPQLNGLHRSLKMVSANASKELPNVLPNGNPFVIPLLYDFRRDTGVRSLLWMPCPLNKSYRRTLTSPIVVNAAKMVLSQQQQQQQQHHFDHDLQWHWQCRRHCRH